MCPYGVTSLPPFAMGTDFGSQTDARAIGSTRKELDS